MSNWRLVADVGGTNARFARASDRGAIDARRSYDVSRFASFIDALSAYLEATGHPSNCVGAAVGAAGPVDSGIAHLTNAPWIISASEISQLVNAPTIVVNDLEAAAFSLPTLTVEELRFLGQPADQSFAPTRFLAANVGTGFGSATLIKIGPNWVSCPSEAGHMTFARATPAEACLPPKFACIEHVLSGKGLTELYAFAASDASSKSLQLSAAQVLARAHSEPAAAAAADYFTQFLARTLSDLVLATAAWDGVFLFGSVAKGWAEIADANLFRQVFDSKGAMTERMKRVPVALVLREDAALSGLAFMPLRNA